MAFIARSIEMSFSASRLFRTLRSMSIVPLLVRAVAVVKPGELDLYPPGADLRVSVFAAFPVDVQSHAARVRLGDTARYGQRPGVGIRCGWRPCCDRRADQAADGPPPVLRLGQRAVHARRGHLEGVRLLPPRRRPVERGRKLPADLGDVVQADPAV